MPRRDDPFAGAKLSDEVGLDQRLFQEPAHSPTKQPKEGPNGRTAESSSERTSGELNERPAGRPEERPKELRKEGAGAEAVGGSVGRSTGRQVSAPQVGPSGWPGQKQRLVDHRSYDFFQDQVRWLNRKKLELEEKYGKRVAATDMVQLAVDLLIADYAVHGEDSQLIRVLIQEERPFVRTAEPSDVLPDGNEEEEAGGG